MQEEQENGKWGDVKYCIPKTENLLQKVNECAWNSCYTIENSYVGRCARSIPAITLQDIELYDNDYIYLDRKNLQENVSRFFMFIKPMECCKHCKGSNGEAVQAAIQL